MLFGRRGKVVQGCGRSVTGVEAGIGAERAAGAYFGTARYVTGARVDTSLFRTLPLHSLQGMLWLSDINLHCR